MASHGWNRNGLSLKLSEKVAAELDEKKMNVYDFINFR
jgi:hypothetical protein